MRESVIEHHLKDTLEAEGFLVLKFKTPGYSGVMDRMILWPVYCPRPPMVVELKAPGKDLRPLQRAVADNWKRRGVDVRDPINTLEDCEKFCKSILSLARNMKQNWLLNNSQASLDL